MGKKTARAPKKDMLDRVYRRSADIVARRVGDEFILVPIRAAVADTDAIYTLNRVGAELWRLLDGTRTLRRVGREIMNRYRVGSTAVESDIRTFIRILEKIGAVTWV